MPQDQRALTRATRARAAATGEPYTKAREQMLWIQQLLGDGSCETREEAGAFVADPANQVMCTVCGWTYGMVCPECPGCGCYNGRCSGWRHGEFMDEDERRERDECPECGGDSTNHYECRCFDDEP